MADTTITQVPSPSSSTGVPQVSAKDTKAEILAAYQELLKHMEDGRGKSNDREQDLRRTREETVVRHASGFTTEKIVQGCRNLEAAVHTSLGELAENLIRESKKLSDVQEAITLSERRLQEVHDNKIAADSLVALIEAHRAKEREHTEMVQRCKYEWRREEEAYAYDAAQRHKREEDVYQEKRANIEKELQERRQAILLEEQEIKVLRRRAENFDAEVTAAKSQAAKEAEDRLRREEKMKADLLAQEMKREKEIAQLKIHSLTERLEQMTTEVAALRTQLMSANHEAKEIALKVIEGASTLSNLRRVHSAERTAADMG